MSLNKTANGISLAVFIDVQFLYAGNPGWFAQHNTGQNALIGL